MARQQQDDYNNDLNEIKEERILIDSIQETLDQARLRLKKREAAFNKRFKRLEKAREQDIKAFQL